MKGREVVRLGPLAQRMIGALPFSGRYVFEVNKQNLIALRVQRRAKKLLVVSTLLLLRTAFLISRQQSSYSSGNAFSDGCQERKRQETIPSSPIYENICSERGTVEY